MIGLEPLVSSPCLLPGIGGGSWGERSLRPMPSDQQLPLPQGKGGVALTSCLGLDRPCPGRVSSGPNG